MNHGSNVKKQMELVSEFSYILKPSPIGGIGVFATHDIPSGTLVFTAPFKFAIRKVKDVPAEFIKYCIFLSDEECMAPERFDRMEIGWYINHSDKPNIAKNAENKTVVVRDIKAGDEFVCDYNKLNEPDHLKESYYWPPK